MFSLRTVDEEYVNRPGGQDAGSGLWFLIFCVLGLMFGFILWAAVYEIEEVTRATGRVVPSSQVQMVQTLDGGVVSAIDAAEGDQVEPGQVLFQIDDTDVQSSLGELEQRHQALSAELVRLRAEAAGAAELNFAGEPGLGDRLVDAETSIFETRRDQLAIELNVLRDRLAQRRAELAELVAQQNRIEAVIAPLKREVEISEDLFAGGTLPEVEILRLRADLVVASTDPDVARLKPNPAGLLKLLRLAAVEPQRALLIGDRRERDGEVAARANMRCLILSPGKHKGIDSFSSFSDRVFEPLHRGHPTSTTRSRELIDDP